MVSSPARRPCVCFCVGPCRGVVLVRVRGGCSNIVGNDVSKSVLDIGRKGRRKLKVEQMGRLMRGTSNMLRVASSGGVFSMRVVVPSGRGGGLL